MKISDYAFTNDDAEYALIKALLLTVENHPEMDNCWEPGRMDIWRYNVHAEKSADFFKANVRYWKTETNQVVGLFITEYGGNNFFIVVHPDYQTLLPTILKWGLDVWAQGKSKISTEIYSFAQQKIAQFSAVGFYEDGHRENVRTYIMAGYDFVYDLKPDFKMMSFSACGNLESRVKLAQNAFNNPKYTAARLLSTQQSPNYKAELDLVIVNADGECVAYCMGWVEENDPTTGFIEPMGTHSDYRKNGFGKALAKECFKRLSAMGVEKVWIVSFAEPNVSNFLYESLHPTSVKRSYTYSLKLEE